MSALLLKDHFVTIYYFVQFFMLFSFVVQILCPHLTWTVWLCCQCCDHVYHCDTCHTCLNLSPGPCVSWSARVTQMFLICQGTGCTILRRYDLPPEINCELEHEIYQFYCSAAKVAIWEAIFCNDLMKVQVCVKLKTLQYKIELYNSRI